MGLRASVVIPTHNRWEQLRLVLEAYGRQTVGADAFEVFVCDDASDDGTAAAVPAFAREVPYRLHYLRQEHKGAASARNLGIGAATAPVVVFTDDDCVPEPALLERHLASTRAGVATIGRVQWHPSLPITPFMAFIGEYKFGYEQITDRQDAPFRYFLTANASAWREDLLAAGGFDETFRRAHEDIELGYRLHRHGVRFVYDPEARILHLHAMTLSGTLRRQVGDGEEAAIALSKHAELMTILGLPSLRDPGSAQRFYRAAMDYAFVVGLQGGLEERFGEDWPAALDNFLAQYPGYTESLEHQLGQATEYARRLERENAALQRAHDDLAAHVGTLDVALRRANPLKNRLRALLARRVPPTSGAPEGQGA